MFIILWSETYLICMSSCYYSCFIIIIITRLSRWIKYPLERYDYPTIAKLRATPKALGTNHPCLKRSSN
jgi:hypothetical protein